MYPASRNNRANSVNSIAPASRDAKITDTVSLRRHKPDYLILIYTSVLMLLGLVVIYAIGPQRANVLNMAYGSEYSGSYFFIKQLLSIGLASVAFLFMAFAPYTFITKISGWLLNIALGLCLLLAFADLFNLGIAQQTLGATRWFNLGFLGTFQPAEFLKFAILLFLAGFLGVRAKQGKINDKNETFIPLAIVTSIALLFIVIIQKDLGTGVAILGLILSMLFVAGISRKNLFILLVTVLIVGAIFIVSEPHRVERVLTFFKGDDVSLSDDDSYQVEHAKLAVGTGGLFGVGIGNSVQATGYLPEAINDSVFAIMGEVFGFVGLMLVLALFAGLLFRLLKIMDHTLDMRLKLIIAGVFGWLGCHIVLNIASMTGVFPLTGITLPLLSFGGTSMIFIAAALGLVFQFSSYTVHSSKLKEAQYANLGSRRGLGRSRHPSFSSNSRN